MLKPKDHSKLTPIGTKYWMRAQEFTKNINDRLKTFVVKLKLQQKGYHQQFDTMVQARNSNQARQIIKAQYGSSGIIVGLPREIKSS